MESSTKQLLVAHTCNTEVQPKEYRLHPVLFDLEPSTVLYLQIFSTTCKSDVGLMHFYLIDQVITSKSGISTAQCRISLVNPLQLLGDVRGSPLFYKWEIKAAIQ